MPRLKQRRKARDGAATKDTAHEERKEWKKRRTVFKQIISLQLTMRGLRWLCLLPLLASNSQAFLLPRVAEGFDIIIPSPKSHDCRHPLRRIIHGLPVSHASPLSSSSSSDDDNDDNEVAVVIKNLKDELQQIATRTNRGFKGSSNDRQVARDLITKLSKYNPTKEPASPYYYNDNSGNGGGDGDDDESISSSPTLSGKWTLIYTDAPDITSLDRTTPTAKLGRIGQECSPPYIKNVIEWLKPDWVPSKLPFSGTTSSRILQKVVTTGTSSPTNPLVVNLSVAGLELQAGKKTKNANTDDSDTKTNSNSNNIVQKVQEDGLPVGLLSSNPIDLKGPLNPPFGKFTVLYLDNELRVIQTNQNFVAVNRRIISDDDEWF